MFQFLGTQVPTIPLKSVCSTGGLPSHVKLLMKSLFSDEVKWYMLFQEMNSLNIFEENHNFSKLIYKIYMRF